MCMGTDNNVIKLLRKLNIGADKLKNVNRKVYNLTITYIKYIWNKISNSLEYIEHVPSN